MKIVMKYRLKKDLPGLEKGVIFEHREYDNKYPDRGNHGCGVMILGWLNGNCQGRWCGNTYIFPGQLANDKDWFEPISLNEKEEILAEIEFLKDKIRKL